MTNSFFTFEKSKTFDLNAQSRINFVKDLKKGSHVHVSGACGTGTGAILCLLKRLGFYVTGSDKAFYPPMAEFIEQYADKLFEKFSPENLHPTPDLVVIGNALSRNNVEVEKIQQDNIPFCSMPELLAALLIGDRDFSKTSIVVSGTHGKTTTTALIAHTLKSLGLNPGYFFGGVPTGDVLDLPIAPVDFSKNPEDRITVIEGDEYDSAFFAKYSKFHNYRPDILIITNIEFDHGDIFTSVEDIESEFVRLLRTIPSSGSIIACQDDERARLLVEKFLISNVQPPNVLWYGKGIGADVRFVSKEINLKLSRSVLSFELGDQRINVQTDLTGNHNALNIAAVFAVGISLKLDMNEIAEAIKNFCPVKRRQQILVDNSKIVLIEDFAHHPTEVACTLEGIREVFPNRRLIAVFEPRSNTSRKAFFKDEYIKGLSIADVIFVKEVDSAIAVYSGVSTDDTLLNVRSLVTELQNNSKLAFSFLEIELIAHKLQEVFVQGDVVVVMSNGDFGGLIKKLEDWSAAL